MQLYRQLSESLLEILWKSYDLLKIRNSHSIPSTSVGVLLLRLTLWLMHAVVCSLVRLEATYDGSYILHDQGKLQESVSLSAAVLKVNSPECDGREVVFFHLKDQHRSKGY